MGVFCVNTKSKEFIKASKRLDIHPDSLEVYVHLFLNSISNSEQIDGTGEIPFPSDEQIREYFSLGNPEQGKEAIDEWVENYGDTDGFVSEAEVQDAIKRYGKSNVHTYANLEGNLVHKVSRPTITNSVDLKYLLEKLNIIDKDYNLLGIDIDRFYERIDNLAIPADLLYSVEKQIIKRIALNNDTFMKAPNGEDTNLNEDQWLTVRTRAFKEWFGDWEKLAPKSDATEKLINKLNRIVNSNSRFASLAKLILDNKALPYNLKYFKIDNNREDIEGHAAMWNSLANLIEVLGNNTSEEEINKALLHELIHYNTENLLNTYKTSPQNLPQNVRENIKQLYSIIEYAKKYITDNFDEAKFKEIAKRQNSNVGSRVFYAFDNQGNVEIDEFISEIFTNPGLQEVLNEIPYKETKQTLWDKIKECIQNIFGISINKGSVLEEALKASTEFITKAKEEYNSVSKVVDEHGEPLVVIHSNGGLSDVAQTLQNQPYRVVKTFDLDSRPDRYQRGAKYEDLNRLSSEVLSVLFSNAYLSFTKDYLIITQSNNRLEEDRRFNLEHNIKELQKAIKLGRDIHIDAEDIDIYNPKNFQRNIADVSDFGIATTFFTKKTEEGIKYSSSYGPITGEFFLNIKNAKYYNRKEKDTKHFARGEWGTGNIFLDSLVGDDFDGAIAFANTSRPEYVVSRSKQIKSATDNKGTFSSSNDNIYFQKSILTELKKLKQLNQPLGKAGSISKMKERLKRANLDPIITNSIIKAVEIDNSLASLTPLEIFNLVTRQQEKSIAQQYNEYIQKPINKALEQHLLDFLKPFHIEALEDGVVDKYGVTGLFDILNKVIHLAKAEDRNSITVTEEVAHAIVELLGAKKSNKEENKDYTFLVDNIENTDIYKQVYEQYKDTYTKKDVNGETVPDIAKIKKEAIGQALAVAINNKWENKYDEAEKSFWDKLKEWIDKIFTFFADKDYINIDTLLNKIATEVIHNDYSRFQKVDSSNYKLLDFSESIANQNKLDGGKAVEFMQFFTGLGNIITGSIAYRKQGPVYRGKLDALHDIDMVVPLSVHGIDLKSTILQQALKTRETPAAVKEFLYNTDYFKQVMDKYPKMKIFTAYSDGEGGIVASAVYSEDENLSERFAMLSGSYADRLNTFTEEERSKMYLFDFFIENSDREEGFIEPENNIRLSSWPIIFKAKLDMGRAKDIFDYQMWDVFEEFKSQTMSPEEYLMFQKPIQYNPEQLEAIRQVGEYLADTNATEDYFLITGSAGTGKTTIINLIIENEKRRLGRNPIVYITAIANQAVKVLSNKIEAPHTRRAIATAFGYEQREDSTGNTQFIAPKEWSVDNLPIANADIVIIDEASMLNTEAINMILEVKKRIPEKKFILLGDINQLGGIENNKTSVEERKNVFDYDNKKEARLLTRVRQGELSPIVDYSDEFRRDTIDVSKYEGKRSKDLTPNDTTRPTIISKEGAVIMYKDTASYINEDILNSLIPIFKEALDTRNPNLVKIVAMHTMYVEAYNNYIYKKLHPEETGDLNPLHVGDLIKFYNSHLKIKNPETETLEPKFFNSDEFAIEEVNSDPYIPNLEYTKEVIEKVGVPDFKMPKFYVQDVTVKREGKLEKITVICPTSKNIQSFKKYLVYLYNAKATQEGRLLLKEIRKNLKESIADINLGYAVSIHKSQGSTYDAVIVDAKDVRGQRTRFENGIAIDKKTGVKKDNANKDGFDADAKFRGLYTGITRARNVVVVLRDGYGKGEIETPVLDIVTINNLINDYRLGKNITDEDMQEATVAIPNIKSKEEEKKQEKQLGITPLIKNTVRSIDTRSAIEEQDDIWNEIFLEHNNKIEFIEDTHEYWYYPKGKEYPEDKIKVDTSVTSITNPVNRGQRDIKDTPEYLRDGFGWLGTSAAIGTSADRVIRDFFMGIDITARKYPNFTKQQIELLVENLNNFKKFLDKRFIGTQYRIITNAFSVVGKIVKQNDTSTTIGGTLDILVYDEFGNYEIYDIKTSRSDLSSKLSEKKLAHYISQVNMYRKMLEAMHPELKGHCTGLGILQLNTYYATPNKLDTRQGVGTTRYTVDSTGLLLANGEPIELNKDYIAPHFPQDDVQKAFISIDITTPKQYYIGEEDGKEVMIEDINAQTKPKAISSTTSDVREPNLKRATEFAKGKSFAGMVEEDEIQKIISGELTTIIREKEHAVEYYKKLKIGNILEFHNKAKNQSILVKITKPLTKKGDSYELAFEYVKDSFISNSLDVDNLSTSTLTPIRTTKDNLNEASINEVSGKAFSASMWEVYENNKRDDVTSETTLDAIVNGEKTATTRYSHIEGFYDLMQVGDIVEFHDSNTGKSILVKITKAAHKLSSNLDIEEWSKKEGWSTQYYKENVEPHVLANEAYQLEYEYIEGSLVDKNVTSRSRITDITISQEKDKLNYRKGTPQKHPDTAYIFTENAQAHNKLEGKKNIGPDSYVILNVGKNRGKNDPVNQADIRTGFDGKKTENAFGIIVKKYQQDGSSWVAQEGCFKDTDEDFKLFKKMNTEMFESLENSKYSKMVFPYQIGLGKAALPKRFAEWLQQQLASRYGIITTVQKNTKATYNGYGLNVEKVEKTESTFKKVIGENISSKGSDFAKLLTNYGNTVSVDFKGRTYRNAEHAYQTWKSGEFDEVAYNSTAAKPKGSKKVNTAVSDSIMVDIITAKLQQHPELVQGIKERGGLAYINASTHDVVGDLHWETNNGKGDNGFIKALAKAYQNVALTKANKEIETDNFTVSKGAYQQRTKENADWSDITLALATDFSTAGETLTAQQAGSTDERYLGNRKPREGAEDKYYPISIANIKGKSGINATSYISNGNIDGKRWAETQKVKEKFPNGIKLNIAGNGIYTLINEGITQEEINDYLEGFLFGVKQAGVTINEVRSGGLTGVDEAGIIAALKWGIKWSVHAPNNWAFRVDKDTFSREYSNIDSEQYRDNKNGTFDIMDEELFKARFSPKSKDINKDAVHLIYKRMPELAEIGTEEEYLEYLHTIYPLSIQQSVYWHGSNEDFSEGFESAKRGQGSGALETLSRHDFYLAKQAWTVLQYINGVNRTSVDKNGFAHWNKLWWELKEIMSNGRRENNDWKNIIIGDASLRQAIPNKKGIFNRDKGGTNGKWLKERKADYGYEDKSDKEFFEDIFGIEWNKDTFGSWIERNAEIFKNLEDSQEGIYPVLIDVRNPITESGQDTYYEENRSLMTKADKEGFDTIISDNSDNEFNSDVAVVLNIGTSPKEMSKRIHFLGTKEDRKAFLDFVDTKKGLPSQKEYDEEKEEETKELIAIASLKENNLPPTKLYSVYELKLIQEREALNALKEDKDSLFRPTELGDWAKACMFLVSDFITQIQTDKQANKDWIGYLDDANPRKLELLDTDFTQMSRIEICATLGFNMYAVIQDKYFANPEVAMRIPRTLRKKLTLINLNFNAFLEMGQNVVARLENIEYDNTQVRITTEDEEVFNGLSLEEISEIAGSSIEHWQVSFRNVSAHASLSLLIKRTIGTLYRLDENNQPIVNDFNIPERINESLAVNLILMWTQGSEDIFQMVEKLKELQSKNPWLSLIISKLDESSEDETFKAQFWSNFKKYFQPYIIQYLKPIKDAEGKEIGSILTNKVINQRSMEKQLLDDFTAICQSRMTDGTPMRLYDEDGKIRINEEESGIGTLTLGAELEEDKVIKQLGTLSYSLYRLWQYREATKELLEDNPEAVKPTALVKSAIRNIYSYLEIELDDDTIDALAEDYNTVKEIYNKGLHIYSSLRKEVAKEAKKKELKDFNLVEHNRKDLERLFSFIVDNSETTLESVAYEDGKLHYSYVVPSYLSNLVDKLKGNIGSDTTSSEEKENAYLKFLEDTYGKYPWFKQGGYWRNRWLELLDQHEEYRKEFQHAVVLTTRPYGASVSVGYRDKSPMLYAKSMLQNYFYGGDNSNWAFYRIPIMSNKPSEEYLRFWRYIKDNYKDEIARALVDVALLEIDRIATVRQRKTLDVEEIKSFDKNGDKFLFLDYLQPIIDKYHKWAEDNEGKILLYATDEEGNILNKELLLGQMLEQRIQGTENLDNEADFNNTLMVVIKEAMSQKFQDYIEDMRNEGLLAQDKNLKYIHLQDLKMKSEWTVMENLENFFWNDTFAAINILQLTVTDIAYYKNAEDLLKRLALIHAPGLRGNKYAKWKVDGKMLSITDGKTRTIYIADFDKVVSDAIENIKLVFENKAKKLETTNPKKAKEFRKLANHIIEAFEAINVTDAQGYNSPSSYRKKAIVFGKWDNLLEEVYQKIRKGKYDIRDLEVMMQPLKPFVYSNTTKESQGRLGNIKVGMQNKNSEYLLLMMDAILQGESDIKNPNNSKLSAIYQVMEESHYDGNGNYKTNGIDTVQFNSTVKAGEMGVIDINSASTTEAAKEILEKAIYVDSESKDLGYNVDRVHELEFDDYCIQNEVPAHLEGESIFGSQMRILSISDMPEVENGEEQTIRYRNTKTSIREVKQTYMNAIAKNILQSMDDLVKKFNINGTRALKNIAISKLLLEQIKSDSRFGYDLLYSICTDEKGNFNIPLSDPINAGRVLQLLHSIIKTRINKQMIEGGPVVLVTNFGTSKELDIVFLDAEGNKLPTLREWFATQDFSEYNIYSYEEYAKLHRYKKAKESSREYKLYHETYLPLKEIISKKFQEEVASKQAGIKYIECYAPSTVFKLFADKNGVIDLNKIPEEMKEIIGFRIPTEFKYSMAPLKIVGLLPSEAGEGIMLPKDITTLSGSDFDVDKLYIIRPVVKLDIFKIRAEFKKLQGKKYDNKAIWDDIYETYPQVTEAVENAQRAGYKEYQDAGNTGSFEDYLEYMKSQGITKKHQWLGNSKEVFEKVTSTWENMDEYVIYDGSKLSFKDFIESKKSDASYYTKIINNTTKAGRDNIIFDTIYAMLTSELAMDLIFTPGNFDEPKKYGYIAEALRLHPEMSYEKITNIYEDAENKEAGSGVDALKDLIAKSKNLVYNNVHLAFHKLNMVAGKLIGIFAQNNVSHSIISLIDLTIRRDVEGNPLYITPDTPRMWKPSILIEVPVLEIEGDIIGGGEVAFDTLYDKKGNRISNTLAAFLAASVDAVKDPVLNFMNINETTAGILTTLVRMGYDTELAMLFLTQPIIKKVIAQYAIDNEKGYVSLNMEIDKAIKELNTDAISIVDLETASLSKASLIKTLKKATAEENINLLRALSVLNDISRVTSSIVTITKFNSVTSAAGPMLGNTLLMKKRVLESLEMPLLQTESMLYALNNPIIKTFREKEFEAVDKLFIDTMLLANPQFNNIMELVEEVMNGTLNEALINKLLNFYIAFMMASTDNPIFKTSGNNNPISEARRTYIYKQLPWKIKKLKKANPNNKFLKNIKVMPIDDSHEYYWLKLNTRGMSGSTHDEIGLYWQELYQEDPQTAMELIEYNFVTSGLNFSPNSFANLIPVALKKIIPNYIQLLDPNRTLNKLEIERLIDLFIRNNHFEPRMVKRIPKLKTGVTFVQHLRVSKDNDNIINDNKTSDYVAYNGRLYKKVGTDSEYVMYKKITDDSSKIKEGTPSLVKEEVNFKIDYIAFDDSNPNILKDEDTYYPYIQYDRRLFKLYGVIGNKVKYLPVSKLGGKYGEILEINPSGEVEPIDLTHKKINKDKKKSFKAKIPKVVENSEFSLEIEKDNGKQLNKVDEATVAQIQWFILNRVPREEQKERIAKLTGAVQLYTKGNKYAPKSALIGLLNSYSKDGYNKKVLAKLKNIGDILQEAINGLPSIDKETLNDKVKNILDTLFELNTCD